MKTIMIYEPGVRASARRTVRTIPGVDSQLLTPPARPRGERCTPTCLPLHDGDAWLLCAVNSARYAASFLDIKMSINAFAFSCACASADFFCVRVTLRSESA